MSSEPKHAAALLVAEYTLDVGAGDESAIQAATPRDLFGAVNGNAGEALSADVLTFSQ